MNLPNYNSKIDEFMYFSDIDYIITDLDGTFVQHGDAVWNQLHGIQSKFHNSCPTITIATGRTYYGTRNIAEDIHIKKNIPIILYNGAVVVSNLTQTILYKKTIPISVLYELCQIVDFNSQNMLVYYLQSDSNKNIVESVHGFGECSIDYDVNGMKIVWHDKPCINKFENNFYELYISMITNDIGANNVEIPLFQNVPEPCSILISKKNVAKKQKELTANYLKSNQMISYTDSGSGYFEIKACGVNKSIIFEFIKDFKKMKCIAIGDNNNDVELLKEADIGVAVANASDLAIDASDYQCRYAGTNGVLELIEVIKSANRYCERKHM